MQPRAWQAYCPRCPAVPQIAVSSAISQSCCCLYLTEIKLQCFVVLVEVTVYCYGWRLLSSWKQMAVLYRNVFRPSSRCYQHREAVCSMSAIQCFAQAYTHYVFSSAVSIQGHSQLRPQIYFCTGHSDILNRPYWQARKYRDWWQTHLFEPRNGDMT